MIAVSRGRRRICLLSMTLLGALGMLTPAAVAARTPQTAAGPQTVQQRAARLVAQMTLDEKIAMVHGDSWPPTGTWAGHVPGVPRLGIPDLYLGDGPNGVGNGSTGVTQFPVAVTTAASWDRALADAFGTALGAEQRGKGHNVALAPTLNILRTPLWGRESETYTEDPYLNGQTAAAEIRGIQSQHVIATAKHFVANNQETGRLGPPPGGPAVSEQISERALQEIYYPGFKAAVQQGRAGAVMCAYQQVDGQYACQNPSTLHTLEQDWHWPGFVMTDWLFALRDTVPAAKAGLDMEMPNGAHFGDPLKAAVLSGQVPISNLNDMVSRILTSMIRLGVLDHPVNGVGTAVVSTPAHRTLARLIAEQGTVLLKNSGALPFSARRVHSLAVIGTAAGDQAQFTEGGSGAVNPSEVVTPINGIRARAGASVNVTYEPGTLGTAALPPLTGNALHTPSGSTGLTATYYPSTNWTGTPILTRTEPEIDFSTPPVTGLPPVWSARWNGTLTPPTTGQYRFSLSGGGAFRMWINGKPIANDKYADFPAIRQPAPIQLSAGHPVSIRIDYSSAASIFGANLHMGWQPPDPALRQRAVDAARAADAAVVFVNDVTGEGSDRNSLTLPGDQNQLITDVARANPNTVVVLNTGGPVLTPWLNSVAGVLETWYPGQEYGDAIARLLFGDVNPSGKLPMTWPANSRQGPASDYQDLKLRNETYDEGLLVGYRWYEATGQQPLFPFGYGLSYTTFRYAGLRVVPARHGTVRVSVRITNTGHRTGAEAAQLYLRMPAAANEPPKQLKGYAKVTLGPGQSTLIHFRLSAQDLAVWRAGSWTAVPGTYQVMVGSSSRDIRTSAPLTVH